MLFQLLDPAYCTVDFGIECGQFRIFDPLVVAHLSKVLKEREFLVFLAFDPITHFTQILFPFPDLFLECAGFGFRLIMESLKLLIDRLLIGTQLLDDLLFFGFVFNKAGDF